MLLPSNTSHLLYLIGAGGCYPPLQMIFSFRRERNDDCKLVGAIIDRPREAERLPYRKTILYLRRGGVSPPVVPIKSRNRYLLDAFSFDAKGPKEKALRKENAAPSGAARTRELLKKSSTKNYLGIKFRWCGVFDAFFFDAKGTKKKAWQKKKCRSLGAPRPEPQGAF